MADSETTVTETRDVPGVDDAQSQSDPPPIGTTPSDALVDEMRDHFESARDRLAESGAFLEWIQTTKSRLESELEAQQTATRSAVNAAESAAAEATEARAAQAVAVEALAAAQALTAQELAEKAAPTATAPAAVSSSMLRDAVAQLDGADSQAELLSRLLEQCCRFAGRSALLLGGAGTEADSTAPAQLEVWNASGFVSDGDSGLKGRSLDRPAAWESVLAAKETVLFAGTDAAMFAQALGCELPTSAVAIPFILRDSAYAVLYADNYCATDAADADAADKKAERDAFDIDALQLVSFVAAQSMECLNLRSVRPAATIVAPALVGREGVDVADDSPDAAGTTDTPDEASAETGSEAPGEAPVQEAEARLFANQLSAPVQYQSAATEGEADEATTDTEIDSAKPLDLDYAREAEEPAADTFNAERTAFVDSPPSPAAVPEQPEAKDQPGTEWSLSPELDEPDAGHDAPAPEGPGRNVDVLPPTPVVDAANTQDASAFAAAMNEKEASPPTFVSVVEDAQPVQPPPPPASPFATQVIHTGTPELPPLDLSESAPLHEEEPSVDAPTGRQSFPDVLPPSEPSASSSGAFDLAAPQVEVTPPRPLALDTLESVPAAPAPAPAGSESAGFAATPSPPPLAVSAAPPPSAPEVPTEPQAPIAQAGAMNTQPAGSTVDSVGADQAGAARPGVVAPPASPEVSGSSTAEVAAPQGPSKTVPGSAQVTPPSDLAGPGVAFNRQVPEGEDPRLDEARRLARLLVSELKLYNEDEIARGKRLGNIYQGLREDIDRSRRIYDERVDPQIRQAGDFLHEELVQGLANGDPGLLGM